METKLPKILVNISRKKIIIAKDEQQEERGGEQGRGG
jgi:hypothetical protein